MRPNRLQPIRIQGPSVVLNALTSGAQFPLLGSLSLFSAGGFFKCCCYLSTRTFIKGTGMVLDQSLVHNP